MKIFFITFNLEGARAADCNSGIVLQTRNWLHILHPADSGGGGAGGLTGQDSQGVNWEGLVGRPHLDDGRRLVGHRCHLQVGLRGDGAGHAEGGADEESLIFHPDTLTGGGGESWSAGQQSNIISTLDGETSLRGDLESAVRCAGKKQILISLKKRFR